MNAAVRCLSFCAAALALASDWPQWRGRDRDGVWKAEGLPQRLPEKLAPRWKVPLGAGYGGLAVTDGRVYVMDRMKQPKEVERVVCLDARTGDTLWAHEYPVAYGKLDYGNGPRSTPTVHQGRVYAYGALGRLSCLDAKTGDVKWSRDAVKDFGGRVPTWGHACSPLLDLERVVVQVGAKDGLLMALDRDTGKEAWRAGDDPPGYSSPVVIEAGGKRQYAFFTPRHVIGVAPSDGKVLWKVPFPGIDYDVSITDVVFGDGALLAGNYWSGSKGIVLGEKGVDPKVVWEGKGLSLLMSTPLVKGKHAYALDKSRGLVCVEMRTGKIVWDKEHVTPRDRNPHASLAWVGGDRALVLNTPGELSLVELTPAGLKKLGKAEVIGKTWAHPAFADGCVFARSEGEAVCVPLAGR